MLTMITPSIINTCLVECSVLSMMSSICSLVIIQCLSHVNKIILTISFVESNPSTSSVTVHEYMIWHYHK